MDTLSRFILPIGAFTATLLSWAVLIISQRLFRSPKNEPDARDGSAAHHPALNQAAMQVNAAMGAVATTPAVLIAAFFVASSSQSIIVGWDAMAVFIGGGLMLWGYAFFRWRSALGRQRELQWHIAAREMVEQAVVPLEQRGYVVIRDFKSEPAKFDYLLIGPKGVFTLQALVHPIAVRSDQMVDITVTYDGRTLFFPNEKDHHSIETAQAGAEQFSEWLSEQLGSPIAARAIVALPGWQIKRISAEGISVIHPGQLEALFQYVKARPLTAEMIQQITRHIRQHQGNPQNPQDHDDIEETTGSYS